MKENLLKLWKKVKKWAIKTALPWLKTGWIHLVSLLVLLIAYGNLEGGVADLVGFWAFILIGFWLFWKLLGADKVIKSAWAQWRNKRK